MSVNEVRAELETDLAWRQEEIRFFQNQSEQLSDTSLRDKFRRATVVLLYAHFEGYCKFALSSYVNFINRSGVMCGEAQSAIAAASLGDVLSALRHPSSKCAEFKHSLPDDATLHLFAREREFVEKTISWQTRRLSIPDDVVNTESNLKPVVLRKNLYRLGLPLEIFEAVEGDIHRLVKTRNGIAHGEEKNGVEEKAYNDLRDAAFRVMQTITAQITAAISDKKFLRAGGLDFGI